MCLQIYLEIPHNTNGGFDNHNMICQPPTAASEDCESGKYCKRAGNDCGVDISACAPCTAVAPGEGDPWREHFEKACGWCTQRSPSSLISLLGMI